MTYSMDLELSRRLERTEGAVNRAFVEARGAVSPEVGATFQEVSGTYAMFDGASSPLTQTFCLGLFGRPSPGDLATIETFFSSRNAPCYHEVSPLAGIETYALLFDRGYRPIELTTVLMQRLDETSAFPPASPDINVGITEAKDEKLWVEASGLGWANGSFVADTIRGIGQVAFKNQATLSFGAVYEGQFIATGSLGIVGDVALLAGASTVPAYRRKGAQAALLNARLHEAKRRGCTIAMMCADPGSSSQRNAERNGFRVAYTRTKWLLPFPNER